MSLDEDKNYSFKVIFCVLIYFEGALFSVFELKELGTITQASLQHVKDA